MEYIITHKYMTPRYHLSLALYTRRSLRSTNVFTFKGRPCRWLHEKRSGRRKAYSPLASRALVTSDEMMYKTKVLYNSMGRFTMTLACAVRASILQRASTYEIVNSHTDIVEVFGRNQINCNV